MNSATNEARIAELTTATKAKRGAKAFDSEYWSMVEELGTLRRAAGLVKPSEPSTTFTGSYAAAVKHFGGPVRHAGGGMLSGSAPRWVKQ